MLEELPLHYLQLVSLALILIGLYGMLVKRNLMKKLIGMNIFQSAIILFFIFGGSKWGATVPTVVPGQPVDPTKFANPLPHVLMLTAIVVSVATTGVALAILISIYRRYGSLDEQRILERMRG